MNNFWKKLALILVCFIFLISSLVYSEENGDSYEEKKQAPEFKEMCKYLSG